MSGPGNVARRPGRVAAWLILFLVAGGPPSPGRSQVLVDVDAGLEAADAWPEDFEPMDLNRADEAQLLQLPGMDPALARAILTCRRRVGGFESLEAMAECAGVPAGRLLAWRAMLRLEPTTTRRAMTAGVGWNERRPDPAPDAGLDPVDGWRRRDYRWTGQLGWLGGAARVRTNAALPAAPPTGFEVPADSGEAAADGDDRARSFVLRARPHRALGLTLGDFAPAEGLGILVGVTRRAPPRGARGALVGEAAVAAWAPLRAEALDRAAPYPAGRFLRGGALRLGRRLVAAGFELRPGDTLPPTQARPHPMPLRGLLLGLELGRMGPGPPAGAADSADANRADAPARAAPRGEARLAGPLLAPRALLMDGRRWFGGHLTLPLAGGEATLEAARDPAGRWRGGLTLWRSLGRSALLQFTALQGARSFVNPLGADAARGFVPGDSLSAARNDNHDEAALRLELRARRGLLTTLEVRGGSDPATPRRAFDRSVGAARLRVEATPGRGWTLQGDLGLEVRGAPGPSVVAEAPLRRPAAALRAGWQRGRAHFRCGLSTRLDLAAPRGAGTDAAHLPATASPAALFETRGRWPLSRDVWLGGGMAHYHLPTGALMTTWEERPGDLSPGITLRGKGQRAHLALSVDLPFGAWGVYAARERGDGLAKMFWGTALRVRLDSAKGGKRI